MKTIAYTCSYELNENTANNELQRQTADIKNFCKVHKIELDEVFVETSTRDDFKPTLLNILSNFYGKADKLIITNPEIISRNEDFRNWICDELKRIKLEVIFLNVEQPSIDKVFDKNMSNFKEKIKNIPSLPEIITKSLEIMQDKRSSAADLSKIISSDIGLTARVLKLVNSAYYGFPKQISTIQHAITVLGFTTIKGIILSASIFKMFSNKGNQQFDYKDFWKYSILSATTSKKLLNYTDIKPQEDIFSAVLLHDIGKIIFAQYDWEDYSKIFALPYENENEYMRLEEDLCGLNHCEIANLVAYSWNLPEMFCDIITYHHYPQKSENFKNECELVYISDTITEAIMRNKNLNIDNITLNILEKFNISVDNIIIVHDEIKNLAKNINDIDSFFE